MTQGVWKSEMDHRAMAPQADWAWNGAAEVDVDGAEGGFDSAQRRAWQLSAAMDGDRAAMHGFAARLDDEQTATWSLYHLVGDALRSDGLAQSPADADAFARRFAARLAAEPPVISRPTPERKTFAPWRRLSAVFRAGLTPPMAAAAAVVSLAWVLTPAWHGAGLGGGTASTASVPDLPGHATQLASAQSHFQRVDLSSDRAFNAYLAAHQQFASDRGGIAYSDDLGSGR